MRCQIHNKPVQFRVNDGLLAKARERAVQDGMSLSELVRLALRNQLRNVN